MIKKLWNKVFSKRMYLLQDWVLDIDLIAQSSLTAILRGNDGKNGNCDESKKITKMLRYIIVNDVGKKNSYMSSYVVPSSKVIGFLVKTYPNNKHWVEHVLSAAYHIKKFHPNRYTAMFWGDVLYQSTNRINSWKDKEAKRVEEERYVNRIYSKYLHIYTKRYI